MKKILIGLLVVLALLSASCRNYVYVPITVPGSGPEGNGETQRLTGDMVADKLDIGGLVEKITSGGSVSDNLPDGVYLTEPVSKGMMMRVASDTVTSSTLTLYFGGYETNGLTVDSGCILVTFNADGDGKLSDFSIQVITALEIHYMLESDTYKVEATESATIKGEINGTVTGSGGTMSFSSVTSVYVSAESTIVVDGNTVDVVGIDGSNTVKDPYRIRSAEDFLIFAEKVNSGEADYYYAVLEADVDLNGINWQPIGTKEHPFQGTFSGNGFVIKNLTVNDETTYENKDNAPYSGVGLFGVVQPMKNSVSITLIQQVVIESGKVESEPLVAGAIVGRIEGDGRIEIRNCINKAAVTSNNSAGGIVGLAWGESDLRVYIWDTKNEGEINAMGKDKNLPSDVYSDDGKAGGIIGAKHAANGQLLIQNCENTGHVEGAKAGSGGMIGFTGAELAIIDSENHGEIGGDRSLYSGGIAGYFNTANGIIIQNATNDKSVTGTTVAGGIIGLLNPGDYTSDFVNIQDSSSDIVKDDNIVVENNTNSGAIKAPIAGGIAGKVNANSGPAVEPSVAFTQNVNNGNVTGETSAGEIIGDLSGGTDEQPISYSSNSSVQLSYPEIGKLAGTMRIENGALQQFPATQNGGKIIFAEGTSAPDSDSPLEAETTYTYQNGSWAPET